MENPMSVSGAGVVTLEINIDGGTRWSMENIGGLTGIWRDYSAQDEACVGGGREGAHRNGEMYSSLNGRQPIFALLGYHDIQTLEGRLLTIVDASFSDPIQRKAFKDLIRKEIWFNWVRYLDTDEPSGGMPDLGR